MSIEHRCNLVLVICLKAFKAIPFSKRPNMDYKVIKTEEGHVFAVRLDNENYLPLTALLGNGRMASR